jgi:hypothetical protein
MDVRRDLEPYQNLEAPDVRDRALADPRGFLESFPKGAVLDEIQRAPARTSNDDAAATLESHAQRRSRLDLPTSAR